MEGAMGSSQGAGEAGFLSEEVSTLRTYFFCRLGLEGVLKYTWSTFVHCLRIRCACLRLPLQRYVYFFSAVHFASTREVISP